MQSRRGLPLLVLLLLAFLSYDIGRHVLVNQNVPAFFVEKLPDVQIALDGEWEDAGVFQISDGLSLMGVIKMAGLGIVPSLRQKLTECLPLQTGERFTLQVVRGEVADYSRGWMSAAQRVALGVPLHPDRMTEEDWDYLPGVGSRLAGAIERDRQNNGDYVELESLARVRGVGPKRVKLWKDFFQYSNPVKNGLK